MNYSKKEIALWKGFIEDEYKKMNVELEKTQDSNIHSLLRDQLIWLKHQMGHFQSSEDLEAIEEDFSWVVANFNRDLHSQIKFKSKP